MKFATQLNSNEAGEYGAGYEGEGGADDGSGSFLRNNGRFSAG